MGFWFDFFFFLNRGQNLKLGGQGGKKDLEEVGGGERIYFKIYCMKKFN